MYLFHKKDQSMTEEVVKNSCDGRGSVSSLGVVLCISSFILSTSVVAMPNVATLTDSSSISFRVSQSQTASMQPSAVSQSAQMGQQAANADNETDNTATKAISDTLAKSQIVELSSQRTLTPTQFVAQLAVNDYVILGEYHDSVAQHQLAYWLLDQLHQQRPQGSLLVEMMRVEQQPYVDKLSQSANSAELDLNQIRQSLAWQASWDWQLYGPIVAHPIKHHYPLLATNLDKSEVSAMMKQAQPLKGNHSTNPSVRASIKDGILANHHLDNASAEDMQVVERMIDIQQHRDRRMAEKLLLAPSPSLLLTGNFHAQKTIGVPVHLADLQSHRPDKKQGVVVRMVDSLTDLKADKLTDAADYAWIIPDD